MSWFSVVFSFTLGSLCQQGDLAAAIDAVVPGAKVRFDAPPSARVALTNRDSHADLSRAKKHLGYEPQFRLQAAVKDQAEWMRRYMARE